MFGMATIRSINPELELIPNNGSGAVSPLNAIETSRRAPMLAADRQARHGLAAPWLVGKSGKEYRATMGDKPVIGLFGIGPGGAVPLEGQRDQQRGDSHLGAGRDCEWDAAVVHASSRRRCTTSAGWARLKNLCVDGEEPAVSGGPAADGAGGAGVFAADGVVLRRGKVEDYALGWYQALVESRIPFEMVHDRLLDAEHLAKFKTLILPNIAALSDAQCDQLAGVCRAGWERDCDA